MDITSLIIEAVSGAVDGNVAGAAMKEKSLGAVGNSIAGIVGGGLGGTILQTLMGSAAAGGGMDLQSFKHVSRTDKYKNALITAAQSPLLRRLILPS